MHIIRDIKYLIESEKEQVIKWNYHNGQPIQSQKSNQAIVLDHGKTFLSGLGLSTEHNQYHHGQQGIAKKY